MKYKYKMVCFNVSKNCKYKDKNDMSSQELWFPPSIKLTATMQRNIVESGIKHP
jgi:hypothetical protein